MKVILFQLKDAFSNIYLQLVSIPGGNASHRGLNGSEQSDALLMMHLFKDGWKHCAGSASIEKEVAYAL